MAARYLAPAPPERLAVLRMLVVGFALVALVVRLPELDRVGRFPASRFDPVGPWAFLDAPLDPQVLRGLLAVTVGLGVLALVGAAYRVTGPAFALGVLLVAAYRSSFGQIFHTEHLLVLHLLVVGCAPAAATWSIDRRRASAGTRAVPQPSMYGWPVRLCTLLTVLTYVLGGWAKLRHGGTAWLGGDVLRHQVAFDNVRKLLLGDVASPIAAWAVARPWLFAPLAWATLLVELGAPVVLLGRRIRVLWVAAAWAFHVGIVALMAIAFPYQLTGVAFASMFRVERLPAGLTAAGQAVRSRFNRNASARSQASVAETSS